MNGRRAGESEQEQLDRNYNELLQELRVTQTGTQILFAFLLTVAFTPVMVDADDFTRRVYAVTLVLCAVATAFLIAPVAVHRTVFRRGMRRQLVALSDRCALVGVRVLLLAVTGALLLALDIVMDRRLAVGVAAGVGVLTLVLWVVVPLVMRADAGTPGADRDEVSS